MAARRSATEGGFISYILIAAAYIIGSIPVGLLLTRTAGLGDIRQIGSGNIGATNVFRTGNKKIGALTFALDVFKGFICPFVALKLGESEPIIYASALMSVIGHIFPVWLKFKGGKGVATSLGTAIVIAPLMSVLSPLVWLVVFRVSKTSSLASIIAIIVGPIYALYAYGHKEALYGMIVAALVLYRHKSNISRIITGDELSFNRNDDNSTKAP